MATSEPITISQVTLAPNPAPFLAPFCFAFTFLPHHPLAAPLHWKIIYVGSATDEACDQVLEEFDIEQVEVGVPCKFAIECPPPDWRKIPPKELLSLTAIIITVSYANEEFVRIGYYVHIMIALSDEKRKECPPEQLVKHLTRTVLIDKPRITKFKISASHKKESSADKHNTPLKNYKEEGSNSMLSASKTSCAGDSHQAELPSLSQCFGKKEKKIRKHNNRASN